jgi:hypothetical protein
MPKPTVLDALNEALGTSGDSGELETTHENESEGAEADDSTEEAVGDDSDAGGDESTDGEGADSDADAKGEGGEEGEEEVAEGEEASGERNADGTFKKKAGEEKPGEKPVVKKVADPINDPIPKDLKQETRQRMESLVKTAKEVTAERDAVRNDFSTFVGGLQAAGVSPEQYGETLSWLQLFNSGDPTQQVKALELVEGIADRLATLLGKERSTSDPLKNHSDLQLAVQQGKVTKEYAAEIARTRNANGFRQELTTTHNANQQQQFQAQQELQGARNELSQLEDTLRKTDPDYERKKAIIVPALKPVMNSISPKLWKEKFLAAYQGVKLAPTPRPVRKIGAQPLRGGKQPAGGQSRAAASPLDAMNGALSSMK